ncbi:helix-turn-helix domain-containing protein [Gallaecimonas mangrovi]|uniref:helix-turn-helix domain-containing protein n=1 Tax=Gallaecimonas mangrovi TaxID=2291597 RepID=UPI001868F29C|nr:helix-turn-helix domain-containing protein [Gallaecimonas mangrovi]
MDSARHLVESTNYSLADIARQSGFSNEALMRKAFLRCLQLTPKQLRVAQLLD